MESVIEYREYVTAWAAYLGACTVLIIIGCLWTSGIRNTYIRSFIRLVASTVLLLPIIHEDANQVLVPALVVVVLGAFIGNTIAAVKAMNLLVLACIGAGILSAILARLINGFRAKRKARMEANMSSEISDVAESEIVKGER
ncbi:hypothetical protein [Litorivivens sp.]|uniref:hypothetical protein n=1 Tax=Litorivivens sp. TaxID=2020868 RepID=UPI003566672A